MLIYIIIASTVFLLVFMDLYYKHTFSKTFPPNVISDLDNTVELAALEKEEIPRIIYRTQRKSKLDKYQKALDITQRDNPTFRQVIFDDDDISKFISENYSDRIFQAYNKISDKYGPAKADFFRILILYAKGGVYLDIKSAGKNLEELCKHNKLVFCAGRDKSYINFFQFNPVSLYNNSYDWSYFSGTRYGEYNNWCIVSPRGNYVLGKMIQQIVSNIESGAINKNYYIHGEYSVLALTGPICYSRIIDKYKNDKNSHFLTSGEKSKYFKYSCLPHKKMEGKDHYSKNKDKNILR